MLSYKEYEKKVYDWLISKHQNHNNFTFSTRKKASKGSETKYFIGTEKLKYFGTTFWTMPAGYPGSANDCIDLWFQYRDNNYKYQIEFKQTNLPDNSQNKSVLDLLNSLKEPLREKIGLSYETNDSHKIFAICTKTPKESYETLSEMLTDVDKDLGVVIALVNEYIEKEKAINPDFVAHRITLGEFEKMQQKMERRFKKYAKINANSNIPENLKLEFIDWLVNNPKADYFDNDKQKIKSELDDCNEFFDIDIFQCSKGNYKSVISLINSIIYDEEENDFSIFSEERGTHRPRAILGNRNYLKFLKEKFNMKKVDIFESFEIYLRNLLNFERHPLYSKQQISSKVGGTKSMVLKYWKQQFDEEFNTIEINLKKLEWLHNLTLGTYPGTFTGKQNFRDFINELLNETSVNIEYQKMPLNQILYGPPGTGKTYNTILKAAEIIENRKIENFSEAKRVFNQHLGERIEFITFHQNYSYEDFIQGLRPDTDNDKELTFEKKDGIFKVIADKALKNIRESEEPTSIKKPFNVVFNSFFSELNEGEVEEQEIPMKKVSYFVTGISNKSISFRKASGGTEHTLSINTLKKMYEAESILDIQGLSSYYTPLLTKLLTLGKITDGKTGKVSKQNYVIVIDEINRANISRVFGELITLIEKDKRSHGDIPLKCTLPSGEEFIVPSNLFIIGTMNTADKSIALLDIALRRRFEFESMYPKYEIEGEEIYDVDILEKINKKIIGLKGHDFQIGHAYFMGENNNLVQRMNKKVIPLLLEYFMNDDKEVKSILTHAGLELEENAWPLKVSGKRA